MIALAGILLLAVAAHPGWIVRAGGVAQGSSDVDLRASWVTDSDISLLAAMPEIRKLDLSLTRISDRGMRGLRTVPGIEDLNLSFAEMVGDEGTSALRNWKHLRRLNLRGTKITDATLEMLGNMTTLESLDIGYAQLTDAGLEYLSSLTKLRSVSMGGNKLTDAGLQFLRQLPQVQFLDISGAQRTDSGLWSITLSEQGVDAIAGVSELKELRVGGTALAVNGLRKFAALPRLERLSLQGCKRIGHESVPVLAGMTRLRWLDLKDTGLGEEDMAALRQALPLCEILR
jgi:Leucine-rich repeat (LRR) protein